MDPAAGGEEVSVEQGIGGAINNSKVDAEISEDIGRLLPTEVSSAESDNFDDDDDGDGNSNDLDQENENLLDEITEEDVRISSGVNDCSKDGENCFSVDRQDRKPLSVLKNVTNGESDTKSSDVKEKEAETETETETEMETGAGTAKKSLDENFGIETQSQSQPQSRVEAQSQAQAQAQKENKENVLGTEGGHDPSSAGTAGTAGTSISFRGRPSSCVFVASLAASLSDDKLCISVTDSFKQYGQLARVKVLRDPANRPYAFVQYTNDRDAKRALKMARGSTLNGRTLRCESARVNRTLFVYHVTPVYYLEVADLYGKFGELEQLVPSNDENQFGRRYNYPPLNNNSWFVQFAYRDDAIRAFANLRANSDWDVEWVQNIEVPKYYNLLNKRDKQQTTNNRGKPIAAGNEVDEEYEFGDNHDSFSSSNASSSDDRISIDKKAIFVGQLDQSVTKETLFQRFSTHGKISDLNLINKTSKVFAFIQFETEEAAAAALERENHAIFLNKTMHVQYKEVGGHRRRKPFRRDGFYGVVRNLGPGVTPDNGGSGGDNGAALASVAGNGGGGSSGIGHNSSGHIFAGPQVNLAPPPINMYRRRTQESDPSNVVSPYMTQQISNPTSEFDMNYIPYVNAGFRRKSSFINNGWSSSRSHSVKSEMDTVCGDGATDATSDAPSESGGQINSPTADNRSSAGSMGQNDNSSTTGYNGSDSKNSSNSNKNDRHYSDDDGYDDANNNNNHNNHNAKHTSGNGNVGINSGYHNGYHNYNVGNFNSVGSGKKKYGKRNNNNRYHDTLKPYYFQPYYYHPMHYPMGPLGPVAPAHPSQAAAAAAAAAAAGNHPYMMLYPMPPPPPTGVDGNILAQPLPIGPPGPMVHGSPPTSQSQGARSEANEFAPNTESCQLDY